MWSEGIYALPMQASMVLPSAAQNCVLFFVVFIPYLVLGWGLGLGHYDCRKQCGFATTWDLGCHCGMVPPSTCLPLIQLQAGVWDGHNYSAPARKGTTAYSSPGAIHWRPVVPWHHLVCTPAKSISVRPSTTVHKLTVGSKFWPRPHPRPSWLSLCSYTKSSPRAWDSVPSHWAY